MRSAHPGPAARPAREAARTAASSHGRSACSRLVLLVLLRRSRRCRGCCAACSKAPVTTRVEPAQPSVGLVRDPVCGTFVVPGAGADARQRAPTRGTSAPRNAGGVAAAMTATCDAVEPMTHAESQLRADIVEVGRRLYARGYTASNDGNISVRLDDRPAADDAEERLQGLHDAGHDVHHRSRRAASSRASAIRRPRC